MFGSPLLPALALLAAIGMPAAPLAAASEPPVVARLGINLPTMGIAYRQAGHDWHWSDDNYFSPSVMAEIKSALHADYVRTGFIPDWVHSERVPWHHEDRAMDDACGAGLGVMAIVPAGDDRRGIDDLVATVRAFFDRYAKRERGCAIEAEIGNEENLTRTPQAYAAIFEKLAPEIQAMGIPVIVAGTSELDTRWVRAVSDLIAPVSPAAYGFHPYDVAPSRMQGAIGTMAASIRGGSRGAISITEYGSEDAATLSSAILALDTQPAITVYEYRCQPTDDGCKYGLKDHAELYAAVSGAFAFVRTHRHASP